MFNDVQKSAKWKSIPTRSGSFCSKLVDTRRFSGMHKWSTTIDMVNGIRASSISKINQKYKFETRNSSEEDIDEDAEFQI